MIFGSHIFRDTVTKSITLRAQGAAFQGSCEILCTCRPGCESPGHLRHCREVAVPDTGMLNAIWGAWLLLVAFTWLCDFAAVVCARNLQQTVRLHS